LGIYAIMAELSYMEIWDNEAALCVCNDMRLPRERDDWIKNMVTFLLNQSKTNDIFKRKQRDKIAAENGVSQTNKFNKWRILYRNRPYSRILGVIYLDDKNVNLEMVKAGLAEVYSGKPPRDLDILLYHQAEAEAKKQGIGMWSLAEGYIRPKDWRKKEKAK